MGRDEASYLEFVRARSPSLFRFALLLTGGDRFGAQDLLQTGLARAYVSWWRIEDAAAAEAYVRRILVNAEISHGRRRDSLPASGRWWCSGSTRTSVRSGSPMCSAVRGAR
jgi:DNA-directed RNA polymerase specialized sigma24 family protein